MTRYEVTKQFVSGHLNGIVVTDIHRSFTTFALKEGGVYKSAGDIGDFKVLKIEKLEESASHDIDMYLDQIETALMFHYKRRCFINKEMAKAKGLLEAGKPYYFRAGLYGVGKDNREHRIFLRDGSYGLFSGWGKSSDRAFLREV